MITLTTPQTVKTVLGGSATVGYDKVVLTQITYDPVQQTIRAGVILSASADASQTPLQGSLLIIAQGTGSVELQIGDILFRRKLNLTAAQQTAVQGWITASQNQVEQGLVSIGLISGNQSNGV